MHIKHCKALKYLSRTRLYYAATFLGEMGRMIEYSVPVRKWQGTGAQLSTT
jgi:hypothetical protein